MSSATQTHIGCLIVNLSCGRRAKGVQREIEYFLSHNGPEWTCNRLKALWNVALHLKNHSGDLARQVLQDNSISYRKDTLLPKGNLGWVVSQFVKSQRPSVQRRYAAVLRFYTSLQLTIQGVSKRQFGKAYHSIADPFKSPTGDKNRDDWFHDETLQGMKHVLDRRMKNHNYTCKGVSENMRYADKLRATSYYYSSRKLINDMKGVPYASMVLSLISNEYCPPSLDHDTPCTEMREVIRSQGYKEKFVGRVFPIQEQGCKARVVAQPSAWVQLACRPYHTLLADAAEKLFPKESCVRDQVSGVYQILQHLENGFEAYSVDLSSATDRFPRSLILPLIEQLGYPEYAQAVEDICQHEFSCDWCDAGSIKYAVGQPMGLYGSFPMFHLANCTLAHHCTRVAMAMYGKDSLHRFPDKSYFQDLGDDIVFPDKYIARIYKETCNRLGIEISLSKSFSGHVAEFAGFVVIPSNKGYTAFRPYKVPVGKHITNPLQFLHAIGYKVNRLRRSKWWNKQFIAYSYTLGQRDLSLSPLVSTDDDKSVGASFRGDNHLIISISNRLAEFYDDLPDLSGDTKINRRPLFRERGPMDFYGYNEEWLTKQEELPREPFLFVAKSISKDPLIKEFFKNTPQGQEIETGSSQDTCEETKMDKDPPAAHRSRLVR